MQCNILDGWHHTESTPDTHDTLELGYMSAEETDSEDELFSIESELPSQTVTPE